MKTILQQIRNPISPLSSRRVFVLIAVVGLTLSPMTQGVTPAPDGGFPNHNTAEGEFALQNLKCGQ